MPRARSALPASCQATYCIAAVAVRRGALAGVFVVSSTSLPTASFCAKALVATRERRRVVVFSTRASSACGERGIPVRGVAGGGHTHTQHSALSTQHSALRTE